MSSGIEATIWDEFAAGHTPEELKKAMKKVRKLLFLVPGDPERSQRNLDDALALVDVLWPKYLSAIGKKEP